MSEWNGFLAFPFYVLVAFTDNTALVSSIIYNFMMITIHQLF